MQALIPLALALMPGEVPGQWTAWDAVAHFRWDGTALSVLMELEAPPCGTERGFAPMTYGIVSSVTDASSMQNSSVVVFIGDVMHAYRHRWTVKAFPCVVPTVAFALVDDWHCAILAPTPMDVHFERGYGAMWRTVDEMMSYPSVPWDQLSNQVFWRGAHHVPETCAYLLPPGYWDIRSVVVQLAQTKSWLNASYVGVTRDVFLEHRYLLDIGGSACATYDAMRWKFASGRLVFKQHMPAVQWFQQFVRPWVHYIPVATNMSDLEDMWRWAENHPEEAQRIAAAGALVGRSPAPRSAANDFATALSLAAVPSIEGESVGKKLSHCHYGACADEETMNCTDYPDHVYS